MTNVLLLFGLFPDDIEIRRYSKQGIQNAANSLQWSLVKGLSEIYQDIRVLNFPYIGSYPALYKKLVYKSSPELPLANNGVLTDMSFINLPLIKWLDIYRKAKAGLEKWADSTKGDKTVIIYSLNPGFLKAAISVKKKYPDLRICLVVTDLPEGMSSRNDLVYVKVKEVYISLLNKTYKDIDCFVFLSELMSEYFNADKSNYTIVEGIYDNSNEDNVRSTKTDSLKRIVYCGTLDRRYGIMNLVDAFLETKNTDYRLILCGSGSAHNDIINAASNDSRILYKGQISHNEVIKLISTADLLVNPRTSEGEFTKYSFPSKTMEYLASGVPTLLYKLEGIPEEYYNYCYAIDKFESIEQLTSEIDRIFELPESERMNLGKSARNFIIEHKNPVAQCTKIKDLIEKYN